jgi:hypothetical protein
VVRNNPPLERTAAAVYFTCGRASRVRRRGRSTALRYSATASSLDRAPSHPQPLAYAEPSTPRRRVPLRWWAYVLIAVVPIPFALMTSRDIAGASVTAIPSMERHLAGLWVLGVGSVYVLRRVAGDKGGRSGRLLRAMCALIALWCVLPIYAAWNNMQEVPDFDRRPVFWIACGIALTALVTFAITLPRRSRVAE